jgi:hypothetical protein
MPKSKPNKKFASHITPELLAGIDTFIKRSVAQRERWKKVDQRLNQSFNSALKWALMSDGERAAACARIGDGRRKWWQSLTERELAEIREIHSQVKHEYFASLSDEERAAHAARINTPEAKENRRKSAQLTYDTPEYRAQCSHIATELMARPGVRENLSRKQTERFKDPEERRKASLANQQSREENPELWEAINQKSIETRRTPAFRKFRALLTKAYFERHPSARKHLSNIRKAWWQEPENYAQGKARLAELCKRPKTKARQTSWKPTKQMIERGIATKRTAEFRQRVGAERRAKIAEDSALRRSTFSNLAKMQARRDAKNHEKRYHELMQLMRDFPKGGLSWMEIKAKHGWTEDKTTAILKTAVDRKLLHKAGHKGKYYAC